MFDTSFLYENNTKTRYEKQLDRLYQKNYSIERFENVTKKAVENINNGIKSFCIYGDPQSGKTEMMILLTAKLLDMGNKIIIILVNDNLQILKQNSKRFSESGLDPTPKIYLEIIDPEVNIGNQEWVVFCKKNPKDLQKLIGKIGNKDNKIIIDDEADFATPNPKISINEQTKINELVELLLGNGIYIGVTATPARLDLNNTFKNASLHWIYFEPHTEYTGQDVFFPINNDNDNFQYRLNLIPNQYDYPKYLRDALLNFLINAAYLHKKTNENYCMLVHTSGKKVDHLEDYRQIIKIFNILSDKNNNRLANYVEQIYNIAMIKFKDDKLAKDLTKFIIDNIKCYKIVIMNSDKDSKIFDYTDATKPVSLFTIAIGGNIISRGITFKNLLSMFFTRDVKHKMQQDTYIQRARMFGNRKDYLEYFQLTIPEKLYSNWHKCFVLHRLSLKSAIAGNAPIWIEDSKTRPVAASSIDKTTVKIDSGEMSFAIFDYNNDVIKTLTSSGDPFEILGNLNNLLGEECLPKYLIDFIKEFSFDGKNSLAIHSSSDISNRGSDVDKDSIQRSKGFIGNSDLELKKYPHAVHHIKIFFNSNNNKARVFYRYISNIKFITKDSNL